MSRIGKLPIAIPAGVTVTVSPENVVTVKGPKGELSQAVDPLITVATLPVRTTRKRHALNTDCIAL